MKVELRVGQGAGGRTRAEVEEADASCGRRRHRGAHDRRRHRRGLRARGAGRTTVVDRRQSEARKADGHRVERDGARRRAPRVESRSWSAPGEGAVHLATASDDRHPLSSRRRGLRDGSRRRSSRVRAAAGLTRALCILAAGDEAEAAQAERVRRFWPDVRFAVGVHPHQAHQFAGDPGARRVVSRQVRRPAARCARWRNRAGLPLRLLAARCPAGGIPRAARAGPRALICRSSSTRARPTTTRLRILRDEGGGTLARRLPLFHRRRRCARARAGSRFPPLFAGIVTFPRPPSSARSAASCPRIGCSSKPTARFWRRCRTGANATSRRRSASVADALAATRGGVHAATRSSQRTHRQRAATFGTLSISAR